MKFDEYDSDELKKVTSNGGKASQLKQRSQDMTFEEIVKGKTTNRDLVELYHGLMQSGKKGNVKAVETLLKYLEHNEEKEQDENEFAL